MSHQSRCSLVASSRLHLGALEEQYHRGRSLLGPIPPDYKLNQDAILLAIEKPSVGAESRERNSRVLGSGFAIEDIEPLSVADGDIARW